MFRLIIRQRLGSTGIFRDEGLLLILRIQTWSLKDGRSLMKCSSQLPVYSLRVSVYVCVTTGSKGSLDLVGLSCASVVVVCRMSGRRGPVGGCWLVSLVSSTFTPVSISLGSSANAGPEGPISAAASRARLSGVSTSMISGAPLWSSALGRRGRGLIVPVGAPTGTNPVGSSIPMASDADAPETLALLAGVSISSAPEGGPPDDLGFLAFFGRGYISPRAIASAARTLDSSLLGRPRFLPFCPDPKPGASWPGRYIIDVDGSFTAGN